MERKKIVLLSLLAAVIGAIIYIIFDSGSDVAIAYGAFAGIVGVPMGGTPTTSSVEEGTERINTEDISQSVTEMLPSRTPLDTIIRSAKKTVKAESQKIGYHQASYKPVNDRLDSTATGSGATSGAPASAYTYVDSELTKVFVQVGDADVWRNHDTLLMRGLTLPGDKGISRLGASGTHLDDVMFLVLSKSGSVLELVPINGVRGKDGGAAATKFVVPNFTADVFIVRMGQAKSELSITADPFALYPALSWQYCQNFMAQVEESTFQRITKKELNWGFSNFEAVNVLSMKMEMELSMLFGQGGEYIAGNDRTYFTRGITRDIENTLTYGAGTAGDRTISKDQYNGWLKEVFDGNNGSANRVLFAGSGLIKSLSCIDEFQKQLASVAKDASLGVEVRRISTNFGTLDIVLAPLFRDAGWEDSGLILDLEHVTKHEFVPMQVTNLDLKSSGQKNADARVLQEVSCLTLRYPDCHAIIKPKA